MDALILGHVGQLHPAVNIAYGVNSRHVRLIVRPRRDAGAGVLYAGVVEIERSGVCRTPHGAQHDLRIKGARLATIRFVRDSQAAVLRFNTRHGRLEVEVDAFAL